MVWEAISGLIDLYIVPQGVNINPEIYCNIILKANLYDRIKKTKVMGSKFDVKLVPAMSELIFHQDGSRPHTALRTQRLLEENILLFWTKDMWPVNSPDRSPIENFW